MSKESILYVVGILVLVSPYLGVPMSWLSVLLPILGVIILVIAYLIRKETHPRTLRLDETPPVNGGPSAVS